MSDNTIAALVEHPRLPPKTKDRHQGCANYAGRGSLAYDMMLALACDLENALTLSEAKYRLLVDTHAKRLLELQGLAAALKAQVSPEARMRERAAEVCDAKAAGYNACHCSNCAAVVDTATELAAEVLALPLEGGDAEREKPILGISARDDGCRKEHLAECPNCEKPIPCGCAR